MKVYGEAVLTKFAKKHAASHRPLHRVIEIVREADWPHVAAMKQTFPATDLGKISRKAVFDVGGNNCRLIATVNFDE